MAEEQTPAAPEQGTGAGQNPPAQGQQPPAAAGTDNLTDDIRNPEAFWKSKAEQFERLHKNASDQLQALQGQIKTLQDEGRAAIESQISKLGEQLEQERLATQQALVDAQRVKAVAEAGLDAELAQFITATTAEEIRAQVDKLAAKIPKAGRPPQTRTGNATEPGGGTDLSWLPGSPTYRSASGFGRGWQDNNTEE